MSVKPIGNKNILDYFSRQSDAGALGHAYLFHGPEGVGKRTCALYITEHVLGVNIATDAYVLQKGSEIQIRDIRAVKEFASLTPFSGAYRAIVIDNAHMLHRESSNALLKLLEEPPGHTVVFLITHNENMLLDTIRSRTELVSFKPVAFSAITSFLERHGVTKSVADEAARYSNGAPGRALALSRDHKRFRDHVALLYELTDSPMHERFKYAKQITETAGALDALLNSWTAYLRTGLSSLEISKRSRRRALLSQMIALHERSLKASANRRLLFENFLINI